MAGICVYDHAIVARRHSTDDEFHWQILRTAAGVGASLWLLVIRRGGWQRDRDRLCPAFFAGWSAMQNGRTRKRRRNEGMNRVARPHNNSLFTIYGSRCKSRMQMTSAINLKYRRSQGRALHSTFIRQRNKHGG